MFAAHSKNAWGVRHDLVAHLTSVAAESARFAAPLGAAQAAYYLGLWHDLGKFDPAFQDYLAACEIGTTPGGRGPDHKTAGARLAQERAGLAALILQGHHGGLQTPADLKAWLARSQEADSVLRAALAMARTVLPDLEPADQPLPLPPHAEHDPRAAEFFLRLLFSALVDADYLDTEAHFQADRAARRGIETTMAGLWERFRRDQEEITGRRADRVATVRHQIYESCLRAAEEPPGLFHLTVPTGGGKTRSALAFALRHALRHGHERIIVAVPFISITEQTAAVYREILEGDGCGPPVVLEHHSGSLVEEAEEDFRSSKVWARLAAENWDAPVIVTTTVQLFESLFARSPSRCRKLHRLARSVVILDEAQSLPPHLLAPCLDSLRELCQNYGTTVVLSTATQPAFDAIPLFRDTPAREMVPDPARFFTVLKRVQYEWLLDQPLSWPAVAALLRESPQALAVLNTKTDALALLEALADPEALHLSTLLCGVHRRAVIAEVRQRLQTGRPCRLVSTQVVEAGVDLDFPVVARALGPLDGVIQAAGRCNREGRLTQGRVIVFRPEEGGMPPGPYRTAAGITGAILGRAGLDLADPEVPRRYFRQLFAAVETDREHIQALRAAFDYPEVARRFSMIEEDTEDVVVTSYGPLDARRQVAALVRELRDGSPQARLVLRRLQPYLVAVPARTAESYRRGGLIAPIQTGLGEWLGRYDPVRGLAPEDPGALVV